jgi:hypothetical protein
MSYVLLKIVSRLNFLPKTENALGPLNIRCCIYGDFFLFATMACKSLIKLVKPGFHLGIFFASIVEILDALFSQ